MLYLLLTADSFRESALEELKSVAKYSIVDELQNMLIVDMKAGVRSLLSKAKFTYGCFPIYADSKIEKRRYLASIHNGILKLGINKRIPMKMECYDINCKNGYSAKDIEVAVGGMLEKDGFNITLGAPKLLAYSILLNSKCYSGYVRIPKDIKTYVDPFRIYKGKVISRAEFKIMEAFETFNLEHPKIAIDVGAAPGGWSLFIAKSGSSVIAIDGAELEYKKIAAAGVTVKKVKNFSSPLTNKDLKPKSIMHLKGRFDQVFGCIRGIDADMIANDMNTGVTESSKAMLSCSKCLKKGGYLVMTVKCIRRNVKRYMREANAVLRPKFRIMRWRVLPHNRQEITLLAQKK